MQGEKIDDDVRLKREKELIVFAQELVKLYEEHQAELASRDDPSAA